jgi:hypothetical protein
VHLPLVITWKTVDPISFWIEISLIKIILSLAAIIRTVICLFMVLVKALKGELV